MDKSKITALLKKADPENNPSMHERQSALKMAQRAMDEEGLSFAALGFSMDEAERIANQFSVTVGETQHKNRSIFTWSARNAPRDTSLAQEKKELETERAKREKAEKFERDVQSYETRKWNAQREIQQAEEDAYHRQQRAEDAVAEKSTSQWTVILAIITVGIIGLVIFLSTSNFTAPAWLLNVGLFIGALLFAGLSYFVLVVLRS